ncbi:prepilin peptidase CpaA [Duganella sacchari]|uniref:Prepilin peptidase CpaA n=1 Tax=Duganella sacchari TaxID=551987 RepID=A0A1M7R8W7_9BURK|nr:prepilin peptidase [Duganella sacchari]SHN42686.1 prepilin peptidase CpaA [Duganella sacchari]
MTFLPLVILCVLLALAVWNDLRTRRIPNALVFGGAVLGLILNTALPPGDGLFIQVFGGIGFLKALAGLAVGLLLLLPMYAMRALGAGDVKLLAMIGAFVGPGAVTGIWLLTLLAGGVLALVVAGFNGRLKPMVYNTWHLLKYSMLRSLAGEVPKMDAPATPSGRLPYAVAIAAGAAPYLIFGASTGRSLFF